ncbi:MAG: hypothetical protein JXP73_20015 [Deltaproteobacteria bacterium]|nr:hypothetical protein [Deltaproteobacteria bacterium]
MAVFSLIPEKACADGYTWVRLQGELEYAVEMWGGKTYADFEATLLETDDAKVKLDVLAAAPALRFHIPVYLDVYYDAAEVEPGRIMTVWVRGSTFDDGKVVFSFLGGAELGIELDAPRYATVGWGVDVGWDIEGKGKPPMLADPSLSADDIVNTPLSLGFYGFSAGGIDLRLTQTVYDGHIDTGMTVVNGQLIDAMGEPLTRRDFIFNDPGLWRKVRLEVSPFLNPGELLELSFEGFAYTLLMKGVYSALGSVLGWEIFEQPVYTIYVVPIPVGDEHFDLSIPIGFPDPDLLPGDFSYSGFPQALDPQSYNQIVGRVRNASSGGTGAPFKVRMSVRQQGSTTWALTHEETIPALAGHDETYVTLPIPTGSLQPGAHEVAIGVDTDNSVVEAAEGNNQRVEAFGMLDRLPNLHVRRDSFTQSPEEAREDEAFTLGCTVFAYADATYTSGAFAVEFQAKLASGQWQVLGRDTVATLDPGQEADVALVIPPWTLPAGTTDVRALADVDNVVAEVEDRDNTGVGLVELRPALADIVVSAADLVFSPAKANPGDNIIVLLTAHNSGGGDVPEGGRVELERIGDGEAVAPLCGTCSEKLGALAPGQAMTVAIPFAPNAEGLWVIRANVVPPSGLGEASSANNVVTGEIFVGTPKGDIEGRVTDADGKLLVGAAVRADPGGPSTTTSATPPANAAFSDSSYRLEGASEDLRTIHVSLPGYVSASRGVRVVPGHTLRVDMTLDPLTAPDLQLSLGTTPPAPSPSSSFEMGVLLKNGGMTPVPVGQPIAIRVAIDGDALPDVTYSEGLQPAAETMIAVPGGPFFTRPVGDTIVEAVVDPDNVIAESVEHNNADTDVITNAEPLVSITSSPGAPVPFGTPVLLAGTASDPTGYVFHLAWRSDRDGGLGRGPSVSVPRLGVGTHTITLSATDEHGEVGSASTQVTVLDAEPPQLTLRHASGRSLIAPGVARLVVSATDDVSPRTAIAYAWQMVGVAGDFGPWTAEASALYPSLLPGTYAFEVKARDEARNESPPLVYAFQVLPPASAGVDGGVAGFDGGPDASLDAEPDLRPDAGPDVPLDAGPVVGLDVGPDVPLDAGPDVSLDAGPDIRLDTGRDVSFETAPAAGVEAGRTDTGWPDDRPQGISGGGCGCRLASPNRPNEDARLPALLVLLALVALRRGFRPIP